MSNEAFYEEMRQKAVNAKAPVPPNESHTEFASSHGPQHIFFVGTILFALSMGLLWLLITGEIKTKDSNNNVVEYFLAVDGSAGKLLKGLVQIVFLQLLFISLGIFYKAFMASVVKKEPDNFLDKVIDAVAKHLEPQKSKEPSDNKGNMQSTLLVSLVLAITVNISVSISNYFEHFKQSDKVEIALNEIKTDIIKERQKYDELRRTTEVGFSMIDKRNSVIEEKVTGEIANSNAALTLMAKATDSLRGSIENFDGISVSNSVSDVSEPIRTALNIENKVNIDNPDNREEIQLLNDMLEVLNNKNIKNHLAMMDNMTSILCVKHEGFVSWAKNTFSAEERKNRLLCEKFKDEKQRLLASIEKTKKENTAVSIAEQ